VKNWGEVFDKFLGPGNHHYTESDITGHVFAAGESMKVFVPYDDDNNLINKTNPLWIAMKENLGRLTTEICYSSTLGECWTLRAGALTTGTTTRTPHCPTPSAITFQQ